MSWTQARVDALKKLFWAGHSASQIAKALGGVSRSAVSGKIDRLGLNRARETTVALPPRRAAVARKPSVPRIEPPEVGAVRGSVPLSTRPVKRAAIPRDRKAVFVAPEGAETIALDDLERCHCRWPFGDEKAAPLRYCGRRKAPGSSYCPDHDALSRPEADAGADS